MEKKVILAHPGRQHSFRVASELKHNNMLYKYITTVYDSDKSYLMKFLKHFVRGDNLKRANSRKNFDLSEYDVIQFCELSGLIEIILSRFDKKRILYEKWRRYTSARFGKAVAKYAIKNHVDAVIMYDTNAEAGFKVLEKKAPDILRIMDVSAANRLYMKNIYERDFNKSPEFASKLKQERISLWNGKFLRELENEIRLTHKFLVPSNFVKQSLKYSGIKEEQIAICPYGSNFSVVTKEKQVKENSPLEAVYVGNVTEMKGIYYLLEAAKRIDKNKVHLTVVGHYDNSDSKFSPYMKHISFTGRVVHDKVLEILSKSDFFVFPSLGEGLSLAVLEAMACGLPCIVTTNSGANDAIIDGENGFVVDIQNIDILQEKMEWFDKNRTRIPEMSCKAMKAIEVFNWENHERCLIGALNLWMEKPYMSDNIKKLEGGNNQFNNIL